MRFLKEYVILFFIIVFIIFIEIITMNITKNFLEEINDKIAEVEYSIETEKGKENVRELSELWKNKENKLEYFMEHKELEEISTKIETLKSNIENDNIDEAKEQIDEIKFRVEHIKNIQKVNMRNIF